MEREEKLGMLNSFCTCLLDEENEFSKTLKFFKKFELLGRNLVKPKNTKKTSDYVTLRFDLWNNHDVVLLAVYDPDAYLELEQFYYKNNNLEIGLWNIACIPDLNVTRSVMQFPLSYKVRFAA